MNTKVPAPDDSGTDGSQVPGEAELSGELVEASQLTRFPMVSAIEGLAASNNRAFGSEAASTLLVGAASHMAAELNRSQKEAEKLRHELEKLQVKNSEYTTLNAVLNERINAFRSNRHLSNLGIFIGTTLLGVGFQLTQINLQKYGYLAFGSGSLLLIISWLSAPKGGEK